MRLEELKYELPETPEFIHTMIQEEVHKQTKEAAIIPIQNKLGVHWNRKRVAVAAVVCLLGTSTVAYAGTSFYHMYLEKHGTYGVGTGIQLAEEETGLKLPKKIHDITINSTYIPDGMIWTEAGEHLCYKDTPDQGGISLSSVLMDKSDLKEVLLDTYVVESEEYTFGNYKGVYIRYDDLTEDKSFDQRIYLLCPEIYRILTIYIGDDVSKEDAYRFAEGLVIQEKDEMIETAGLYTWSDLVHPEITTDESEITTCTLPIHQIGDTFLLPDELGVDEEGNSFFTDKISVCVDEVQIVDDLHLLQPEHIPEEWKSAVDENGKLVQNHLSFIKQGDGVERLDKVVKEQAVDQKLVYTTVTYTNTSDQEINHLLYLGTLMSLKKQENGSYSAYVSDETAGADYDHYVGDSVAQMAEMRYSSVSEEYGDGGNYISSLKPGESVQLHMGWVVNETDLKDMYLNLNSSTCYAFDDETIKTGVVYIGE